MYIEYYNALDCILRRFSEILRIGLDCTIGEEAGTIWIPQSNPILKISDWIGLANPIQSEIFRIGLDWGIQIVPASSPIVQSNPILRISENLLRMQSNAL